MRLSALVASALYFAVGNADDSSSVSASQSNSDNDNQSSSESGSSASESKTASSDENKDSSSSEGSSSNDEDSKTDDSSSKSDAKSDDSKTDDSKTDDSKTDDSKTDDSKTDSSKTDDSSSSASTPISINPVLPPGSLNFMTPKTTDSLYVKIGDYQTFSWNYTNVQVTPTAVNIDVVCALNTHTYTLATNWSYDDTLFVWNTTDTNTDPEDGVNLVTSKYTLRIYNSSGSPDDIATAGYLQAVSYVFGVYQPGSYNSWPNAGKYVNMASVPGVSAAAATILFTCIAFII